MSDSNNSPVTITDGAPRIRRGFDFNIRRRRAAETRYKAYGVIAILLGILALTTLVYSIVAQGYKGFIQANIQLEVVFNAEELDPQNLRDRDPAALQEQIFTGGLTRYGNIVYPGLYEALGVDPEDSAATAEARRMLSRSVRAQLRRQLAANPEWIGTTRTMWFVVNTDIDNYLKGLVTRDIPEDRRDIDNATMERVDGLVEAGVIDMRFNSGLIFNTTSKRPEVAGLWVALIGSLQMMLVVLAVALPIGVAASIYLEEFAPKNRLTDLIEVNINNLAAVPSIVFGILGLSVFISIMGLPRSAAIVGGLVLSLMTLPTIIIATRASLRAVPPSIRQAALGVGASKTQAVFHHVLPLALPGILTGTIIGLAQALGETAPLLMIGMDAFVQEAPPVWDPTAPATSMPSQIYQWAREDDRISFDPRTSAAIMVLLGFLALMNLTAVLLRRRFERRW